MMVSSALLYTRCGTDASDWLKAISWRKLTFVHGGDGSPACSTTALACFTYCPPRNKHAHIVDEAQTLSSSSTSQPAVHTRPADITICCPRTLFPSVRQQ